MDDVVPRVTPSLDANARSPRRPPVPNRRAASGDEAAETADPPVDHAEPVVLPPDPLVEALDRQAVIEPRDSEGGTSRIARAIRAYRPDPPAEPSEAGMDVPLT